MLTLQSLPEEAPSRAAVRRSSPHHRTVPSFPPGHRPRRRVRPHGNEEQEGNRTYDHRDQQAARPVAPPTPVRIVRARRITTLDGEADTRVLDAIEATRAAHPEQRINHRIEHCSPVDEKLVQRIRAAEVTPVPFAAFVHGGLQTAPLPR
ncbi:hypothetical protein [Streptomyces sp. NPDC088246]|uniref:hypothetical protein n=1 Tax=Streptomyces sp. NPDC088246 TaxID=3365842 RepID=UPI003810409D